MLFAVYLALAAIGVLFIAKGSDWATDSLVPVAKRLGTSHVAIVIILVSIMISLPEVIVAVSAALMDHGEIGLGVVLGSVIANIGLMVGLSAMIRPLPITKGIILRDGVFALAVVIMIAVLSFDRTISAPQGGALLLMFVPYAINVWEQEKSKSHDEKQRQMKAVEVELTLIGFHIGKMNGGIGTFLLGMGVMLAGAEIFTLSLVKMSGVLGGNFDLVIGLTLGALGPTIPNIASAVRATVKEIDHVAITETLGSNIFTLLVTFGLLSMLSPTVITISAYWFNLVIPAMLLMSFMLTYFMVTDYKITRLEGGILFITYAAIFALSVYSAGV
ncbi:sodium:calcium antiporter [Candidatus Micrarchaeota archaeon]|nr:sodium:calcium antiporter [Candidatus Micrarchaeota archaeon]